MDEPTLLAKRVIFSVPRRSSRVSIGCQQLAKTFSLVFQVIYTVIFVNCEDAVQEVLMSVPLYLYVCQCVHNQHYILPFYRYLQQQPSISTTQQFNKQKDNPRQPHLSISNLCTSASVYFHTYDVENCSQPFCNLMAFILIFFLVLLLRNAYNSFCSAVPFLH